MYARQKVQQRLLTDFVENWHNSLPN